MLFEAFPIVRGEPMSDVVQARALTTFKSQYGLIRTGQIFTSDKSYADEMVLKRNVEIVPSTLKPDRRQAFAAAPRNAGKGHATEQPPSLSPSPDTADPQANGPEKPASSSRVVRRSKRKTSNTPGDDPA